MSCEYVNTQEKMQQIFMKKSTKSVYFRTSFQPHLQNLYVMALRHKIEWDTEEVAAGYDLSSIYEGVGENDTVPVISSVGNTTGHPAINITAVVKEVIQQVVEKVTNTIGINSTLNSTTIAPPTSSTHATISTLVKKAAEHVGKESIIPVETVCII